MAQFVEAKDLHKRFGPTIALNGVSLVADAGEVVGFLGPNGAGKSTTLRIIAGFLEPDRGDVRIAGISMKENPKAAKAVVGYLPEGGATYADMTTRSFLRFIANIRGFSGNDAQTRAEIAADKTDILDVWEQRIGSLPKGCKRRVALAQAIIHDPPILIMDEPTDGLDPIQRHQMLRLIRSIAHDKAIIISTHVPEEAEAVCDRAIIINHGQIVSTHPVSELKRISPEQEYLKRNPSDQSLFNNRRVDTAFRQIIAESNKKRGQFNRPKLEVLPARVAKHHLEATPAYRNARLAGTCLVVMGMAVAYPLKFYLQYLGTGPRLQLQAISLGIAIAIGGLIVSFAGFIHNQNVLKRRQQKLNDAAATENVLDIIEQGGKTAVLLLRSFDGAERAFIDNPWPEIGPNKGIPIEQALSHLLHPQAMLIAIGDKHEAVGAIKLKPSDDEWRKVFWKLADNSMAIFICPDASKSLSWEMHQLIENEIYLSKTFWFMPPMLGMALNKKERRAFLKRWDHVRAELNPLGFIVPAHRKAGCIFICNKKSANTLSMEIECFFQRAAQLKSELASPNSDLPKTEEILGRLRGAMVKVLPSARSWKDVIFMRN